MNSYVKNCILVPRDGHGDEPIFVEQQNGDVLARLDGFLVVPNEKVPDLDAFLLSLGVNADPSALAI
jgi:hypothetical protein